MTGGRWFMKAALPYSVCFPNSSRLTKIREPDHLRKNAMLNAGKYGDRATLAEANIICTVSCVQGHAEGEMYSYHGTPFEQDTSGARPGCG